MRNPLPDAERRSLAGKRILVTRALHQAGKLSEGLRALGAEPVEVPVLEIQPPASYDAIDRALRRLDSYDWLILTSANAVRAFGERATALGLPLAPQGSLKVAAIGEATADAAWKAGLEVALVPEFYVAESLIDKIRSFASGRDFSRAANQPSKTGALAPDGSLGRQRFLLARAEVARDVIPDALRAAGVDVEVVDAYRNVMPESAPSLLREALTKKIDAATFTSSSSVTHLAEAAKRAGIAFPFARVRAISIGPITTKTLREFGWEPAAEASVSHVPGLIDAVASALSK